MENDMSDVDMATLENLIDRYSVRLTLLTIGTICNEKAAHIQANWHDGTIAHRWVLARRTCDEAAEQVIV
jgi:hypothetical protein